MHIADQIGQMLMVGFYGLEAPDYIMEWLRQGRVGGIILFARNVESPAQLARLTASLHAAAKYPLLIAIDQEGGAVARLTTGFSESPGAMALASAQNAVPLTEQVSHMLGIELRALGINWNFAPALDLTYNPANPAVGTRSFGNDAVRVAELGAAAVRGFQRGGVAACAKHFPGLGNTAIDTHLALPVLDTALDHLHQHDMRTFQDAIDSGLASIMCTHTIFSALDSQLPATLSPLIIQRLLREELQYEGVVASDCMEMKAIADHFSPAETAVLGALAGLDVIIFSHTRAMQEAAYDGLRTAVESGRVPLSLIDAANRRVAALKTAFPAHPAELSRIRHPAHRELELEAARACITLLKSGGVLPLTANAALVEFDSGFDSGILEAGGATGFARALHQHFPALPAVSLNLENQSAEAVERAKQLARSASTVVVATRSANLNRQQLDLARYLLDEAHQSVLVCLRNPFDASLLTGADAVLCTCGDSRPSLEAAAEALAGLFAPTGTLPVTLMAEADPPVDVR